MFLSPADIHQLTGYVYPKRQIAALRRMGINFKLNEAGLPVVTWTQVEAWLGKTKGAEPNWSAMK